MILMVLLFTIFSCKDGIYITNKDFKYKWNMDIIYQDSLGINYRTHIKVLSTKDKKLEEISVDRINTMMVYEKCKWVAILKIERER